MLVYTDADLDPKIKDFVLRIRKMGFKTVASCQGGKAGDNKVHTSPYPWIEVSEKNEDKVRNLVKELNNAGLPARARKRKRLV